MSAGLGEDIMGENRMFYKVLGNTGLHVSVLSYGFWATYGIKDRLSGEKGVTKKGEISCCSNLIVWQNKRQI